MDGVLAIPLHRRLSSRLGPTRGPNRAMDAPLLHAGREHSHHIDFGARAGRLPEPTPVDAAIIGEMR